MPLSNGMMMGATEPRIHRIPFRRRAASHLQYHLLQFHHGLHEVRLETLSFSCMCNTVPNDDSRQGLNNVKVR
jgi:hypothetical protein